VRRQLEIIRRTAERMDRLIQDLLDVSRMEAGHFSLELQPEDAAASLVADAHELLASMAEAKDISVTLVSARDDVFVNADRNRVLQVFSNLIGNAVKFTEDGGRITLSAGVDGD
jgi:signal transduction histidine kinase